MPVPPPVVPQPASQRDPDDIDHQLYLDGVNPTWLTTDRPTQDPDDIDPQWYIDNVVPPYV